MQGQKAKNSAEIVTFSGAKECGGLELEEIESSPQISLWQHLGKSFARDILVTCSGFFSRVRSFHNLK